MQTYTLVELRSEVQYTDGKAWWEEPSCDINGDLMVFDTPEDARDMARFILGADGGDEREPRPEYAPLIGVLMHDYDARHPDLNSDEPQSWSYGWVDIDGVLHEGDYDNDPDHWKHSPIKSNKEGRA